jgi:hypothetical protein
VELHCEANDCRMRHCCGCYRQAESGGNEQKVLEGVFQEKVSFQDNELCLAEGYVQRLERLWQSQEGAGKKHYPTLLAVTWGLEEGHLRNCTDFRVCLEATLAWVRRLKTQLDTHGSDTFPQALKVCYKLKANSNFKQMHMVNCILLLQEVADLHVWERFSFAAYQLVSQRVNLDRHPRVKRRGYVISHNLSSNRQLLSGLLDEGTEMHKQQKEWTQTSGWITAWAQACSLCCSSTCSLREHIGEDTQAFNTLVEQCQRCADFLLHMPLRVQPGDPHAKKHKDNQCADALSGVPFLDTCRSTMALHGSMIAVDLVLGFADQKVVPVPKEVCIELVTNGPVSIEKKVPLDEAVNRMKIEHLRTRLQDYMNQFRCVPTVHSSIRVRYFFTFVVVVVVVVVVAVSFCMLPFSCFMPASVLYASICSAILYCHRVIQGGRATEESS